MANLAIIIGNTDYQTLSRLQCCGEDVLAMKELLDATGRFEDIELILNSDSSQLKQRLRTVVDGHKSIGEIFFYFTGHGFQREAEFFFYATDSTLNDQMRRDCQIPSFMYCCGLLKPSLL